MVKLKSIVLPVPLVIDQRTLVPDKQRIVEGCLFSVAVEFLGFIAELLLIPLIPLVASVSNGNSFTISSFVFSSQKDSHIYTYT
ncbi:unnamed protein product [Phytomonas sp. Hart1]|nr:unnamed protein product [Phytomonas sp. Hart1]|eukprot:CCW71430.1 unnamed protein product [Phytomonas sp. isolate Hart1]